MEIDSATTERRSEKDSVAILEQRSAEGAISQTGRERTVRVLPVTEPTPDVDFGAYYTPIRRYVRGVVRDPDEADDLTQETFLRAYRARDSLRDPSAALPWLYSVATHVCLDRLRQRGRQLRAQSDLDPETVSPPDPSPTPGRLAEQQDMSTCVEAYVGELRDSYRAVLLMHDVKGLTAREIADLLGDSVGSVKIRLHRARKQLQAALEAGCEFSQDESGTLLCDPKGLTVYPPVPPDRLSTRDRKDGDDGLKETENRDGSGACRGRRGGCEVAGTEASRALPEDVRREVRRLADAGRAR